MRPHQELLEGVEAPLFHRLNIPEGRGDVVGACCEDVWVCLCPSGSIPQCCAQYSPVLCRIVAEQNLEKARQREQRRQERLERFEAKRERFELRLAVDPDASEPSSVSNSTFTIDDEDTGWLSSQAEMVLEPYFMSVDNTWTRLQAVGEFIDDTEDYVNITLDSHRNQLIQVDLLLTAGTFCVSLVTLVSGIFGMNLEHGMLADGDNTVIFKLVSTLSCAFSVVILVAFVLIMRHKRLAFV